MGVDSMKRLESFVQENGEPGDSTVMFRREGREGPETMTVSLDPSGHVEDVTYHVQEPDGSEIIIQGESAMVSSPEGDLRFYELRGSPAGPDVAYQERLRADRFGAPAEADIDPELARADLALIEGARHMFELAQGSPEGFKKMDPFEEIS